VELYSAGPERPDLLGDRLFTDFPDMQPLSRVRPSAGISFGAVMAESQHMAVKIAECVAGWAQIEAGLGTILGMIINTEPRTAVTMYQAVENRAAQLRMFAAAVHARLPQHHADTVSVIISKFVRPAMKERDRIAHWCWGFTPDLPDALLLIDPCEIIAVQLDVVSHLPRTHPDLNRIFVVRPSDMDHIIKRMKITAGYTNRIAGTLWLRNNPEVRAQLLEALSNEPPIRAALDRLQASRESTPSTHPPSPEPA
jgi:hypothetical protein